MGRRKNPDNKSREESIKEKLDFSRQTQPLIAVDESKVRNSFSEFWAQERQAYNRPRDLESVLWAHLKSSGHARPELFAAGLAHFGLKK